MYFSAGIKAALLLAASIPAQAWNRLDKDNAVSPPPPKQQIQSKEKEECNVTLTTQALLVIDHQVGLAQLVRDYNTNDFRNNILGHAALGNVFNLPTVLTSSSDTGPNGLMLKEIIDMHPNATFVRRQGEVNAWDNAEFRAAVKATGKKQLIIAGIVTEVCKWKCLLLG